MPGMYVKTGLDDDDEILFSPHYLFQVLPGNDRFRNYEPPAVYLEQVDRLPHIMPGLKAEKEASAEKAIIEPLLESLGHTLKREVPVRAGGSVTSMDYCSYTPDVKAYGGEGYAADFTNTIAIIEAKRYGRIERKYYIRSHSHEDEIWQTFDYIRSVNLTLENNRSGHRVDWGILTDGFRWRLYTRFRTHDETAFERAFLEFDLEAIATMPDNDDRRMLVKLFAFLLRPESLAGTLRLMETESSELQVAVTEAVRLQAFTALEYIATGLWRRIRENPMMDATLRQHYGLSAADQDDEDGRAKLLRLVYRESLVYLLRLLFDLYAEDRGLFDQKRIPKVIKGEGNILAAIMQSHVGIGQSGRTERLDHDYDLKLADTFERIDRAYNGGLYSDRQHPLLYRLDIDNSLFADAIDNLCRVEVKGRIYVVDFSSISVRELGGIYESLLEYKLAVAAEDIGDMPSIVDRKRIRHDVRRNDLYLVNSRGDRQKTGSYYTPDLIVEHLTRTTLDPKLETIGGAHQGDFQGTLDAVLELTVCDPSMGSGHMLQTAYTHIITFLRRIAEENSVEWTDDLAYDVRANVARKCIYGVDLNPIAVELAKLVMWMKVFRRDKPFEFLDYNLTCGNSLIDASRKVTEEVRVTGFSTRLLRTLEEVETDLQKHLILRVKAMQNMPRDTVEQVHEVDRYWREKVVTLQEQLKFDADLNLVKWFLPEEQHTVIDGRETLLEGIENDPDYVRKVLDLDPGIRNSVKALVPLYKRVEHECNPLHWGIMFPHVFARGGFDVIIANPPWDKVKAELNEYLSDFIPGYDRMDTKDVKREEKRLLAENRRLAFGWNKTQRTVRAQTDYFKENFQWQTAKVGGRTLRGDANLFKVFLEKDYELLRDGGSCGIVLPDNLNIDSGATGLRRLLFDRTTIRELIMFENRRSLFDIHRQYKFDVLTFDKRTPRVNHRFDAGFYWVDPAWLDGKGMSEDKPIHRRFKYPTSLIRRSDPVKLTICEFRNERQERVFEHLFSHPPIGDAAQALHIDVYRDFDITNDADLFRSDGSGWPLYRGGNIHHFNAEFAPIVQTVNSSEGEARLAARRKCEPSMLGDRRYRIAWRTIAQPTDSRSLICTVLPRGSFAGNSLNMADIHGIMEDDYEALSGLNTVFSSTIADFTVRLRIAKNVNAFIVKGIPVPRDIQGIRRIGRMALPLYAGIEFERFRNGTPALEDEDARLRLIARLDAEVAGLYNLSFEDYQTVLDMFPLMDGEAKRLRLFEYKNLLLGS